MLSSLLLLLLLLLLLSLSSYAGCMHLAPNRGALKTVLLLYLHMQNLIIHAVSQSFYIFIVIIITIYFSFFYYYYHDYYHYYFQIVVVVLVLIIIIIMNLFASHSYSINPSYSPSSQ